MASPTATWGDVLVAWNKAHPEAPVATYRAFRQACVRAWRTVLRPPDRLPR
jgi:hypothetical protein